MKTSKRRNIIMHECRHVAAAFDAGFIPTYIEVFDKSRNGQHGVSGHEKSPWLWQLERGVDALQLPPGEYAELDTVVNDSVYTSLAGPCGYPGQPDLSGSEHDVMQAGEIWQRWRLAHHRRRRPPMFERLINDRLVDAHRRLSAHHKALERLCDIVAIHGALTSSEIAIVLGRNHPGRKPGAERIHQEMVRERIRTIQEEAARRA